MKSWLRRLRGAIGMGITWSAAWISVVFLLGALSVLLPGLRIIFEATGDDTLPIVVVPAFLGGVVFSAVVGIAARHRKFDELSVPRFLGWGAFGGFVLALVPGLGGLAEGTVTASQSAMVIGGVSLLSALSAAGSLVLARLGEDRRLVAAREEVSEIGLTPDETRKLLGSG